MNPSFCREVESRSFFDLYSCLAALETVGVDAQFLANPQRAAQAIFLGWTSDGPNEIEAAISCSPRHVVAV